MVTPTSRFRTEFRANTLGHAGQENRNLPKLSTNLDSIRTYNFEIRLTNVPFISSRTGRDGVSPIILGAKKVSSSGHKIEPIAVRRLNDTFYYPGGADSEELIITFDHLILEPAVKNVYNWLQNATYNPATGISPGSNDTKAAILDILYLDNARETSKAVSYYGCFPVSFKPAEHNYSTNNEFHTFEATFRYDFMTYYDFKREESIVDANGNQVT